MNRVIIMGSPRSNGRSAHLAEMLFEANIDECPEDEIYLVPVSELEIGPCIACGACRKEVELEVEGEDGETKTVSGHFCVIDDEMQEVYPLLDAADELAIVAPIFFSGASSSLKALLDRLQPYFWANRTESGGARNPVKRPLTLHVIGEGGDPHGYAPLVSEVRSATAVAGFKIERVLDWVGKIDQDGEILAEAEVVEDATQQESLAVAASAEAPSGQAPQHKPRPKLDLGSGKQQGKTKGGQQNKLQNKPQNKQQSKQQSKQHSKQHSKQQGKQQDKQLGKGKRRG